MVMSFPWIIDRAARSGPPAAIEKSDLNAAELELLRGLGVTTFDDLSQFTAANVVAAARAKGFTDEAIANLIELILEVLAQRGQRFDREFPIRCIERPQRPARSKRDAAMREHTGSDFRCYVLELPVVHYGNRVEPNRWSWKIGGYMIDFEVIPQTETDAERMAGPGEHDAVFEAGAWGALLQSTGLERLGKRHEVHLFDAERRQMTHATVRSNDEATHDAPIPADLIEIVRTLALSLG